MELTEQLKLLGLNSSECAVYLFLLQNGASTPPDVSHGTDITRTNCYHLFTSLQEKELIEEQFDGKRKVYIAKHPSAVVDMLRRQKSAAEKLLPELEALYVPHKNKPRVSYLAGWDEIRSIFYKALESSTVIAIGDLNAIEAETGMLLQYFRDEIQRKGIVFKEKKQNSVSQETITAFSNDSAAISLVWGNHVAFITTGAPAFATVIENNAISGMFYSLF